MIIIDYKVGFKNINYTVLTNKGKTFNHELLKDTTSVHVRNALKAISNKLDNQD